MSIQNAIDIPAVEYSIDTGLERCFLCNSNFNSGDKSFLLFNERLQDDGSFDCPLAQLLSAALDLEIKETSAHSTLLCSNCNFLVLTFEKLERKFFAVRTRIIDAYENTVKQFEMLDDEVKNEAKAFKDDTSKKDDNSQDGVFEEVLCSQAEAANNTESNNFTVDIKLLESDELSNADDGMNDEFNEEDVLIYEDQLNLELQSGLNEQEDAMLEKNTTGVATDHEAADESDFMDEDILNSQQDTAFDLALDIYACQFCKNTFENAVELEKHFLEQHAVADQNECTVCRLTYDTADELEVHQKTHIKRETLSSAECQQCGKSFLNQQNLLQHTKICCKERSFACEVCKKTFATKHNLEAHSITHTGLKPFSCQTCNKSFARKAEVVDHERIHAGLRPFKCDFCEASFTQRSNLTSHRKLTHLNQTLHKCDLCERSFKRRRLLEYHKNAVHTGERPYKCDKCSSSFVYKEHFKKHLIIHTGEKPYACEVCGKRFNSRDNRNAHRFVHSDKKPYECVTCSAGFMRKPLLLAHMKQSRHISDTIIVNQPQINGGVLQTTTEIIRSIEESSADEPFEMIIDHLDDSPHTREIKKEAPNAKVIKSKSTAEGTEDDDAEIYDYVVKLDCEDS